MTDPRPGAPEPPLPFVEISFPYRLVASTTLDPLARDMEEVAWGNLIRLEDTNLNEELP